MKEAQWSGNSYLWANKANANNILLVSLLVSVYVRACCIRQLNKGEQFFSLLLLRKCLN